MPPPIRPGSVAPLRIAPLGANEVASLRELMKGGNPDRLIGPDNRTNLLKLFKEREPELTPANKTRLANALK